jgi:hypothetical protein
VTVGDKVYKVREEITGKKEVTFIHQADSDSVRIRIDKTDANTPLLYTVTVKA